MKELKHDLMKAWEIAKDNEQGAYNLVDVINSVGYNDIRFIQVYYKRVPIAELEIGKYDSFSAGHVKYPRDKEEQYIYHEFLKLIKSNYDLINY